jgi:hypothetical protein
MENSAASWAARAEMLQRLDDSFVARTATARLEAPDEDEDILL